MVEQMQIQHAQEIQLFTNITERIKIATNNDVYE